MGKYTEKLWDEIKNIPEEMAPEIYRVIHLLRTEFLPKMMNEKGRCSLKGIWKGSKIDEALFKQAKESLFPYERQESR